MEPAFQGQGRAEEPPRAGVQLLGHWRSCLFRSRSLTLAHGAPLSPRGRVTWVSPGAFPGIVQRKLLYLRRRTPTRLGTERGGDRARHPPPHTHTRHSDTLFLGLFALLLLESSAHSCSCSPQVPLLLCAPSGPPALFFSRLSALCVTFPPSHGAARSHLCRRAGPGFAGP